LGHVAELDKLVIAVKEGRLSITNKAIWDAASWHTSKELFAEIEKNNAEASSTTIPSLNPLHRRL
jgi:hypothetical protein